MIIRTNNGEARVASIFSETMKNGMNSYPALRFEFESGVSEADIAVLLSGEFDILDDEGNVVGHQEGYTTLKNISVVVGQITSAEAERDFLKTQLSVTSENLNKVEKERAQFKERFEKLEIEKIGLQEALDALRIEKMDLETAMNKLRNPQ